MGPQPGGAPSQPQKGVLTEMDTLLMERFALAVPPLCFSSAQEPFMCCWEELRMLSHVGCCASFGQQTRAWDIGCVVALDPCCLPSLSGAFRSFSVCSASYFRFIKLQ